MSVLRALFPTWGDVVAAIVWLLLIAGYLVVRFRDELLDLDRMLEEFFAEWGIRR